MEMMREVRRFGKALWKLVARQDGQDLVEYALVIALIALAATAGMNTLASDISSAFSTVGTTLNADV
jgi:pilus assembly protein Flp/PilA